ncbi:MAG: SIMPL domain-containing protein [Methylococcus sp.]
MSTPPNISPNYELVNGRRVLTGFSARHGLHLELPFDKQRLNAVIDGLTESGSESNFSITFTVEDTEALQTRAMQAAIADAVRKAAIIAEAAGVQLGDILKIDYSRMVIEFDTPSFDRDCSYSEPLPRSQHPDIEPDDVNTSTSITVVWEIRDR